MGLHLSISIFMSKYLSTAAPVIANEFMWGLGVTMYSLVYGRMGDAATAAITITNTVEQVALVFFFGICHAPAVMLGNELGSDSLIKQKSMQKIYSHDVYLVLSRSNYCIFIRNPVASLFDVSDEVLRYV